MEALRLSRLNEFIRRTIALNFSEPVWVIAELVQGKLNKGHYYLELAERTEQDEIISQSSAVIWKNNYLLLQHYKDISILKEGNELKLKVQVEYHPKYGLKLNVLDLDQEYTLGQIAKQRQLIIARLIEEDLWQKNKKTTLPLVIKKLAIITSMTAAGKEDFENHLLENEFGYTFQLDYYPSSMQGQNTSIEICAAIEKIIKSEHYDCIVMIRGGGAKLDLMDFDHYEISKSIAQLESPLLTGIGHQQDESIADMNAFLSLKTPTAVAEYIIRHNTLFEEELLSILESIQNHLNIKIRQFQDTLNQFQIQYQSSILHYLSIKNTNLLKTESEMIHSFSDILNKKRIELTKITHLIESHNPYLIMEKGYSMNYQGATRIRKAEDVHPEKLLKTIFSDGSITSKINS